MSQFKCKMCGGTLEIQSGSTVAECEYCGAKQTLPRLDDEKRANLYDRANHFRRSNEFDKATAIYEQILNEDGTDAEAYWSLVLCHYGIEYVEDPLSHRRVPTVHRAQFTSIFDDDNYKMALKNADSYQRIIYEEEAKAINEIQKGILAISQKEEPFDVFICYKETDDSGKRTHDSVMAQDLYYQLKQEGFKVFFARITLEDKLGAAYEPYIFAALNSAKVMVVLGTKPEYFNAVWVKNEWSRFLSLIKKGEKKMLIPAYKDMDPYNLPTEFSHLQAQDMSKLGFMQDLIRGIKKILGKDKKPAETVTERVIVNNEGHDIAPILRRAFLFAEDGNFDSADEYSEKVLDINPECAEAYVVKLLIELELRKPSDLASCKAPISDSPNYQKAIRFATPEYRETIEGYNNAIIKRIDTARKDEVYARGVELMKLHRYDEAIQYFGKIPSYKDATQKIEDCRNLKETERLEGIYSRATELLNTKQFDEAAKLFASIPDYKDAKKMVDVCAERKETARKDAIYSVAMQRVLPKDANDVAIKKSIEELHTISGYRDVDDQIRTLSTRLDKWYEDKKIAEEQARVRAEEERRTREREAELRRIKAEKTKKKVKKAAIIGLPSLAALATVLVLLFTLVIPMIQYNKADALFNEGKYEEAMAIYKDIGGFSESEQRITVLNGIKEIDKASFDDGIKTILSAGVPVKLTYAMGGGDFSGATYLSVPDESSESGITLLSASTSNVTPLAAETNVPETVEVTLNSSADFAGLQTPGRNGYRFVEWKLDTYNYQVEGTFELKLTAVWSTKDYTVDYDLAGGKLDGKNVVEYDPEDEAFTLINPTRVGYTFAGWVGTDLSEPTINVTVPTGSYGDRTYTATWTANEYTVTYDAAGGTVSSTTQTVAYDSDVEYLIPERTGYAFLGWYENTTKHENGKWTRTSDLSLVAKWEIANYTINYELDGGTNHADNPATYTVNDETITLKDPSRTGYTFAGWTYEGQTTPTKNPTIEKGSVEEKTFTANWVAISSTITLNPNGGACDPITIPVTYDAEFTLPDCIWDGHTFSGWYIGDTKITSGICKFYEDTTLVADWDVVQYSITYTLNGGTNAGSNPANYNYHDSFTLAEPTKTGYTFLGWTYEGQNEPTKDVSVVVGTTGDKTYTANWEANTYTVTFDANGGTVSTTSKDVTFDTNLTLPTPERTGYTFGGWFVGTKQYTTGTWTTDSNVTLVAKWTANSYKATYNANGGSVSSSNKNYTYDANYTLLEPTRTGYEFLGWYKDGTLVPSTGTWKFDTNISLVAEWKACVYTVTYDAGVGTSSEPSAQATYDSNFTLATAERVGYKFDGWYYNGTKYSSGTWKTDKSITLTAKWTARTDIEYVVNHHQQNANDDNYTIVDTEKLKGTADATIKPSVKTYTHFISPSVKTVTIAPDGKLVVDYYYNRVTYDLTYVTNGGEIIEKQTYKYDQTLVITTPTRTGYTFGGWFTNKTLTTAYSATATLNADTTIYAYWAEENKPGDFTYSGTSAITVSAYNGTSTTMWIPAYIGGVPVTTIPASAFENQADLVKVVVPERVTSIGLAAFKGCNSIEDITLPFVGKSANAEGYEAVFGHIFGYVNTPTGNWLYTNDLNSAFINEAYNIDGAVWQYTCVPPIKYDGSNNPYKQTYFNYYIPTEIKNVTITSQTIIPDAAFNGCDFIETVTIPSTVTSIGNAAFQNCSLLKKLNSTIDGMFNIPLNVTTLQSYAFKNCDEMTNVVIPAKMTSIGAYAFNSCAQLVNVEFTTGCKLETIGDYAFTDCISISELQLPTTVTRIGNSAFSGCISIAKVNSSTEGEMLLPNNVATIGDYAFQNLEMITKVVVPNSVSEIGLAAFNGCNNIEDITLPFVGKSANAEGYEAVFGHIFGYVNTPTGNWLYSNSLNLSFINEAYNIDGAVWQYTCVPPIKYDGSNNPYKQTYFNYYIPTEIKNVTITSQTIIPDAAFNGCDFIETVTIPSTVTSIGNAAFQNCSLLKKLNSTIDGMFNIPLNVTTLQSYAFKNCDEMTNVVIPAKMTSIGAYAFNSCAQLVNVEFTTGCKLETIGDYAFTDCISISELQLPTTVTRIGNSAFSGCISIAKVNSSTEGEMLLPNNVATIGDYAFQNLEMITKVVVPNSVSEIGLAAFNGCNNIEDITLPFVGKSANAESYEAVFGYIFGYVNTPTGNWLYTNDLNSDFINQKTNVDGTVWQYTCIPPIKYDGSNCPYKQTYFNYYIPTEIKNVTITSQTIIPVAAFNGCNFINSVTIPNVVTSIGDFAFQNCNATIKRTYIPKLSYWNGISVSTSLSGEGTQATPYQINSAADLAYLANSVNAGANYAGKYFILNVDINLNHKNWTPIGSKNKAFAGIFDGNGKKVYGLSVTTDNAYAGLFGYVSGTIKNLGILSGEVATSSTAASTYAGPLIAYLTGTVENCYSDADVTISVTNIVYAGGLIGYVDTTATVKDSYASGNVTVTTTSGFAYAGGFVGMNKGTIEGSLAFGNVTAHGQNDSYSRNGGFAAKNDGTLTECYRSETQTLVQYTTTGSAYCDDGTADSVTDMISYAQSNWSSSVWEYELKYPSHK